MKYKPNWNIGKESFKEPNKNLCPQHHQEMDQRNGRLSGLEDKVEELDLKMILRKKEKKDDLKIFKDKVQREHLMSMGHYENIK